MTQKFFVIDDENNLTSWPENGDDAECFSSLDEATNRAKALAVNEPSKVFLVCKPIRSVVASVNKPKLSDLD